jgi:hypothetical protein
MGLSKVYANQTKVTGPRFDRTMTDVTQRIKRTNLQMGPILTTMMHDNLLRKSALTSLSWWFLGTMLPVIK